MDSLNVRHYLDIYTKRKEMQEKGITKPSEQIKKFTKDIVEKLKALPLDEKIILNDNSFYDGKGNLILNMPVEKTEADFGFFKTQMPESRKADFYLGCLDGSVFIDFNRTKEDLISLCRISFDGYGCCDLFDKSNHLNPELSKQFLNEMTKDELNQATLTTLVKEIIEINKENLWTDALEEYKLIDRG